MGVIIIIVVAGIVGLGALAVVMETVKELQRKTLEHRVKMKELEVEELRLRSLPPGGGDPMLPSPRDTLIRRGV